MTAQAGEDKKHTGLKARVASALVMAVVALTLIVLGGWYFAVMMMAAAVVALYEWFGLARDDKSPYLVMAIGGLYLPLCFASYIFLRFGFDQGAWLAIAAVLAVSASDTGAYFMGKAIGGPKMAPVISPKKTWAGFAGAVLFSGLMLVLLLFLSPYADPYIPAKMGLDSGDAFCVFLAGCIMGCAGQAGDLLISVFKRRVGKKDMGHIIPGHGGLLDRVDSLLLVSPFFLMLILLWQRM